MILLVCATAVSLAQGTFRLVGIVTDQEVGTPVSHATIRGEGRELLALTDGEGRFSLLLQEGFFTFSVSSMGYQTLHISLDLAGDTTLAIAVGLAGVAENGLPSRLGDAVFRHDNGYYRANAVEWDARLRVPLFRTGAGRGNLFWLALAHRGAAAYLGIRTTSTVAVGIDFGRSP